MFRVATRVLGTPTKGLAVAAFRWQRPEIGPSGIGPFSVVQCRNTCGGTWRKAAEVGVRFLDDRSKLGVWGSLLPFGQAHARATAVFRNELDARLFKGTADRVPICYGDRRDAIRSFCAPDGRHSHASCFGQIFSAPTDRRSRCSDLNAGNFFHIIQFQVDLLWLI